MSFSLHTWAPPRQAEVDAALLGAVTDVVPAAFQGACAYPLTTGGKRIRPLLCFASAEALGAPWRSALPGALAIELIHTFSLVHDDLPCMDNDDLRRGKPTVHRQYDEATALLVGDALLAQAFVVLAQSPALAAGVHDLALATRRMCEGQFLDLQRGSDSGELDALIRLHQAKTGALIAASVRLGARAAGASEAELDVLTCYADRVGLAFQVRDDVLDAHEADKAGGAPNFIRLLGLDATSTFAQRLAGEASDAVASLPDPAALIALARFAVDRES